MLLKLFCVVESDYNQELLLYLFLFSHIST